MLTKIILKIVVIIILVVLSSWMWTENLKNPDLSFIMSVLSGGLIGYIVSNF